MGGENDPKQTPEERLQAAVAQAAEAAERAAKAADAAAVAASKAGAVPLTLEAKGQVVVMPAPSAKKGFDWPRLLTSLKDAATVVGILLAGLWGVIRFVSPEIEAYFGEGVPVSRTTVDPHRTDAGYCVLSVHTDVENRGHRTLTVFGMRVSMRMHSLEDVDQPFFMSPTGPQKLEDLCGSDGVANTISPSGMVLDDLRTQLVGNDATAALAPGGSARFSRVLAIPTRCVRNSVAVLAARTFVALGQDENWRDLCRVDTTPAPMPGYEVSGAAPDGGIQCVPFVKKKGQGSTLDETTILLPECAVLGEQSKPLKSK